MSKIRQKVSRSFRSMTMAHACCRISSHLRSMNMPGHNPLTAVHIALKGDAVKILNEDKPQLHFGAELGK
ncbi:MAG: hypothetical protein OXF20_12055 [Gammaproteobacteria bacterium]|nr:hypothetical protein [Gammaproteobacteria bacterium]